MAAGARFPPLAFAAIRSAGTRASATEPQAPASPIRTGALARVFLSLRESNRFRSHGFHRAPGHHISDSLRDSLEEPAPTYLFTAHGTDWMEHPDTRRTANCSSFGSASSSS